MTQPFRKLPIRGCLSSVERQIPPTNELFPAIMHIAVY